MLDYSFFKKYFKRLGKAAILKMLNSLQNVFGLNKEKEKRKSKQIEACENQQAPSFSIVKQENNFLSFAPNTHMSAHSLYLLSLTHTHFTPTHTSHTHTSHTHTSHTHVYEHLCLHWKAPCFNSFFTLLSTCYWTWPWRKLRYYALVHVHTNRETKREKKKVIGKTEDKYWERNETEKERYWKQ